MAKVINTTFKIRRGDSSVWMNNNPTLEDGELGFELDTGRLKIGREQMDWISLPYIDDQLTLEINNIISTVANLNDTVSKENQFIRNEFAAADLQNANKLTEEIARATSAEAQIGANLNEEISRATAAESKITTNLNAEIVKVTTALGEESLRAKEAEEKALNDAKAYADEIKKNLLGDGALNETYNTLTKISDWIATEGIDTTELTEAIATEASTRQSEDEAIRSDINKLSEDLRSEISKGDNAIKEFLIEQLGEIENGSY